MAKKIKFTLPDNLENETQEYINNVLRYLEKNENLNLIDGGALYMLTEAYNTFIKSTKQLNKEGVTFENNMGNIVLHPAFNVRKAALKEAMDILRDFGLTLSSRRKIKAVENETEESPLENFIKASKNL